MIVQFTIQNSQLSYTQKYGNQIVELSSNFVYKECKLNQQAYQVQNLPLMQFSCFFKDVNGFSCFSDKFNKKAQKKQFLIILRNGDLKMKNTEPKKLQQTHKKTLFDISMLGIMRGALGLPFQHPFQTIKTWMQSQNQSARQSFKNIYKVKGLKGYYAGFGVNLIRVLSKSAYRWPLMIYLLDFFKDLGRKRCWNMGTAGVAAGLAAAIVESVLVCPLERLKIWVMTSYSSMGYSGFWRLKTIGSLFDGFGPVILKQTLSWASFLGSQQYFKQKYYQYLGKDPKQHELTVTQLIEISILVCFVNTLMVMPADYIKTHFQKFSNQAKPLKFAEFVSGCYKKIGILGFYREEQQKQFTTIQTDCLLSHYQKNFQGVIAASSE